MLPFFSSFFLFFPFFWFFWVHSSALNNHPLAPVHLLGPCLHVTSSPFPRISAKTCTNSNSSNEKSKNQCSSISPVKGRGFREKHYNKKGHKLQKQVWHFRHFDICHVGMTWRRQDEWSRRQVAVWSSWRLPRHLGWKAVVNDAQIWRRESLESCAELFHLEFLRLG